MEGQSYIRIRDKDNEIVDVSLDDLNLELLDYSESLRGDVATVVYKGVRYENYPVFVKKGWR